MPTDTTKTTPKCAACGFPLAQNSHDTWEQNCECPEDECITMPAVLARTGAEARGALPRELVKQIAMEIGKEVASHIETMYPQAVEATSKNMLLSVRNSVHNDIMAAVDALQNGDAEAWLERRQRQRREVRKLWRQANVNAVLEGKAVYE